MKILDADRIVGMMHVSHLSWLADKASRATSILEVGSYRGRSTRVLCDNCPGTVTAVDTWDGSPGLEAELSILREASGDPDWLWHEFLYNMRGTPNLAIVRMPSLAAAVALSASTFDMIFIDALHDYDSVVADITAWLPRLADGGLMCGHDLLYPDVARAVLHVFPKFGSTIEADIWAICKGEKARERWEV